MLQWQSDSENKEDKSDVKDATSSEAVLGKILVVHSYHKEYKWVEDISTGITNVFEGKNLDLEFYYMDTKRKTDEAWKEYNTAPHLEDDLLDYFKKRLSLSDEEFQKIMDKKPRSWYEFPTYKKRFERLKPLFFTLAKANLVPMSFYLKYCFPSKNN